MSHTSVNTSTSPDHHIDNNHHRTLYNLLEQQRLDNNENNSNTDNDGNNNDAIHSFSNQFEKYQKKRKISHGDLAPTPSNSPAIHQHHSHAQYFNFNSSRFSHQPNKRLHGLVSPLHLSSSRKIRIPLTKTPPVTPDSRAGICTTPKKSDSFSSIKDRFPSSPHSFKEVCCSPIRKNSSSSSLLLSPDARIMVITESSHMHQPSMLSLLNKNDRTDVDDEESNESNDNNENNMDFDVNI
eukprot:312166_1